MTLVFSLFPGCGHLYNGQPWRAVLWTVLFLAAFLPLSILAYIFWSFTPVIYVWLAAAALVFLLASALGPALRALRRPRTRPDGSPPRPGYASLPAIGVYAALVTFGGALELALFSSRCFREVRVQGSRLEPLLSEHQAVTVLVSTHVRPVHGEVILFEASPERIPLGAPERALPPAPLRLGRILAVPGDSVAAGDEKLLVNSIGLDLDRLAAPRDLARAGRREKLRHLLSPFKTLPFDGSTAGGAAKMVRWGGPAWGPFVVPRDAFLILPDLNDSRDAPTGGRETGRTAWILSKKEIRGRVVF